jgi:DNA-directed RNA polymerase specialized sigma subunit
MGGGRSGARTEARILAIIAVGMDSGGSEDRDAMVQRCASHLVRQLRLSSSIDPRELVQEGHVGLAEAEQRYDASKGVKFEAYAYIRRRGAMLDCVRRLAPNTRKVHAACERVARMDVVMDEVGKERNENKRDLDPVAMADALDAAVGKVVSSYALTSVTEVERNESPEDHMITDLDIVRMRGGEK